MKARSWMKLAFVVLVLSAGTGVPAMRDQYHFSKLDPQVRKEVETFQNEFYNLKEGDFVLILEECGLNPPGLYRVIASNGSSVTLIGPASYPKQRRDQFAIIRNKPWLEASYMKKFEIVSQDETAGIVFTNQWNLLP